MLKCMTCTMKNFFNLGHEEMLSKNIIKIMRDIFPDQGGQWRKDSRWGKIKY